MKFTIDISQSFDEFGYELMNFFRYSRCNV